MMAAAADDNVRNWSKPYCYRVTAQTAADCGDLTVAKTAFEQLLRAPK